MYSLNIGKIMGIPIKLHITFLLILPIFAWVFAIGSPPFGFAGTGGAVLVYSLGMLAAVLLFVSVLLHELAHSYVARKNGIPISSITLYLFGGVSAIEEEPKNPHIEMRMAFVGPLTSIVLGLLSGALYLLIPGISSSSIAGTMIFLMAYMNLALGIFNLLPGFPMDGGRVLRAFLAEHMPYLKATRYAVDVGKLFAIFLGLLGLLAGFAGIWLIMIAFFIYIGAGEEQKATYVTTALEGVKVKDIMTKDVLTISPDATAAECIDTMLHQGHLGHPVMEGDKVIGIVALAEVSRVPPERRNDVKVRDVMSREVAIVSPDDDAMLVLQRMSGHNIGRMIVEYHGRIAGIVSRTDLVRALKLFGAVKSSR